MRRGGGGVPHRIYIVPFSPHILMPKVRKNLLVRAGIEPGSFCFTSDHKNMANHANGHINGFISSSFVTYDLVWRLAVFLIFKKGLITNYIVKIIDKRLSCYIFYSAALKPEFRMRNDIAWNALFSEQNTSPRTCWQIPSKFSWNRSSVLKDENALIRSS